MAYRNGTYVAFDGQGTTNPTESDIRYYNTLKMWSANSDIDFKFSDSHKKTYQVRDSSQTATLKRRLLERLCDSKNMLLIVTSKTSWDRGLLNFEIEKAVETYSLPIIVTYPECSSVTNPSTLRSKWPEALEREIDSNKARCIHIPFTKDSIFECIRRFSVHSTGNDVLTSPVHYSMR
ncbi:MAG: TIR domain-containing protein [Oscillospiraceae bacterium]|jgi:hypothetical protein|nr:TIR domain-containing protein [Oscillospiraceae bacterium]